MFEVPIILGLLGWHEMVLIGLAAVLLFGRRLPEVGRSLGRGIVELKKGLRGVARSGPWEQRGLANESQHVTWHDRVVVEESGPVRAVLAIKGSLTPGDKDKRFYDYTARLYFTAGSPSVRIVFT